MTGCVGIDAILARCNFIFNYNFYVFFEILTLFLHIISVLLAFYVLTFVKNDAVPSETASFYDGHLLFYTKTAYSCANTSPMGSVITRAASTSRLTEERLISTSLWPW